VDLSQSPSLEHELRAALRRKFSAQILAAVNRAVDDYRARVSARRALKADHLKAHAVVDAFSEGIASIDPRYRSGMYVFHRHIDEIVVELQEHLAFHDWWNEDRGIIQAAGRPRETDRHGLLVNVGVALLQSNVALTYSHSWKTGRFARVAAAALREAGDQVPPPVDPFDLLRGAKRDAEKRLNEKNGRIHRVEKLASPRT